MIRKGMFAWARRFFLDRRALAAIEFSLVFPLLAVLLAGGFEFSRMAQTSRRLTTVADSLSVILAATPPQLAASGATPATTGTVTYVTLHYVHDATMLIFPAVLADSYSKGISWGNDISISMAGISFKPTVANCTNGCTYVAHVAWTGDSKARACGSTQSSLPDSSPQTTSTLPQSLFTPLATQVANVFSPPTPVVVVDISYTWTPLAFSTLFGAITITRSAYLNARYVSELEYQAIAGDDGFGARCSGGY